MQLHSYPPNAEQALKAQANSWTRHIQSMDEGCACRVEGSDSSPKPVLDALKNALERVGQIPLLLQPPPAWDSRVGAMAEAGAQLEEVGLLNGEAKAFFRMGSLAEKQELLSTTVRKHHDRIVVLCENPARWLFTPDENHHSSIAAQHFLHEFLEAGAKLVFTGKFLEGFRAHSLSNEPLSSAVPTSFRFENEELWGEFAPIAKELSRQVDRADLSVLQVKLLVALSYISSPADASYLLKQVVGASGLAEEIRSRIVSKGGLLAKAFQTLVEVRRPFDAEFAKRLFPEDLGALDRALFDQCLLERWNGSAILAEPLRRRPNAEPQQEPQIHLDLWRLYRKLEGRQGVKARLAGMEAIFHGVGTEDPEILEQITPVFTDQLDAMGRVFSQQGKRHARRELFVQAVDTFRTSIRIDPENDYAHHYLAYNLDYQGVESDDVETHYRRALELNREHAWWHSRWICFLITRGRIPEAKQAWFGALDSISVPSVSSEVFASLHLWVARLLLHRGQLDFARSVLGDVSVEIHSQDPRFAAMGRLLEQLEEVSDSRAVFPLWVRPTDRWTAPRLCSQRNENGQLLSRWLAARIEAIDEEGVELRVGISPKAEIEGPKFGGLTLTLEQFDRCSRDERASELKKGRFLELAFYGDDDQPTIRVHRLQAWSDPDLPPLDPPDSARYGNALDFRRGPGSVRISEASPLGGHA